MTMKGQPNLKLTPSCSRCRAKKLKCRYSDDNSVCCNICLEKGLSRECHRDVRMSRGKRIKLNAKVPSATLIPNVNTVKVEDKVDTEAVNRLAEITSLRKRLIELESVDRDISKPLTPTSSDRYPSSSSPSDTHRISVDTERLRHFQKQNQIERIALGLEEYVVHGSNVNGKGTTASSSTLPLDVPQLKWQKSTSLDERLQILRAIKQCQFASDEIVVRELVSVFLYRVNHLVGHVIYSPGYQRAVEAFLSMSMEEIVTSKAFIDPCCLATMVLVLCLGYEFHPHHPPPNRPISPGFLAVQKIRQGTIDPTIHWFAIARQSFALEDAYDLPSIPALQAACLFLARGKESEGWMRMMHQVAISSARRFGLHNLGQAEAEPWMQLDGFIRLECGVRIWNYLVMRDWSMTYHQDHLNLICPDQMTTRKPLNLDDEDLERGMHESRSESDWTHMSFVIAQFDLAQLIKENSIVQNRLLLKERIDEYLQRLPPYFQVGSQANSPGLLTVQRWLLHQQVFDLQLRLWRIDLTATEGRLHCLDLAEKIIDHQANIRAICPVIDNLHINFFHLFGACMVVVLDLIHQSSAVFKEVNEDHRFMARSKILKALDMFKGEAKHGRGIRILRTMLNCEDEIHSRSQTSLTSSLKEKDLSLVAERILNETKTDAEVQQYQPERQKDVWPSFIPSHRMPDHTLLPMAGAWSHMTDANVGYRRIYGNSSQEGKPMISANKLIPSSQSISTSESVFNWALSMALDPSQDQHGSKYKFTTSVPSHSTGNYSIFYPTQPDLLVSAP